MRTTILRLVACASALAFVPLAAARADTFNAHDTRCGTRLLTCSPLFGHGSDNLLLVASCLFALGCIAAWRGRGRE
jgi:hypothetical protein